ncbi:hypothetical protein [Rhodovulum euryhalinum]|uniref:Uncharacterized protein n=1 Tax=Rhodovulum euryhalinum TaxID=35805 RepID=A0A4R2KFA1_9RHOB|nr:hypothetical protein [Rhodovulum euryhalinum]TCO69009.1 hypothetical protein EV655_1195 [Rhodovulum euryhalinum]
MAEPTSGVDFGVVSWVITTLLGIAMAVLGAMWKLHNDEIRTTKERLDKTRHDLADHRVEVANKYVSHETLSKMENRLDKRFDELRDLLNAVLQYDRKQ